MHEFGWAGIRGVSPDLFVSLLGWWEVTIRVGLLFRPLHRTAILLLLLQMPGTHLPLVLLPEVCFTEVPRGLTLEGQYIIKNAVLIGAALVVDDTVGQESAWEATLSGVRSHRGDGPVSWGDDQPHEPLSPVSPRVLTSSFLPSPRCWSSSGTCGCTRSSLFCSRVSVLLF